MLRVWVWLREVQLFTSLRVDLLFSLNCNDCQVAGVRLSTF